MSKNYFVLRGSKVVYSPGHYDLESAEAVAKRVSTEHPKSIVRVVKTVESYMAVPDENS